MRTESASLPQLSHDAQHGIVRTLRDAILVAVRHGLPALKHHHMFCGPGGLGKTLLAKVLWRELNFQRMLKGLPPIAFFEIVGTAVKGKADLDRIMRDVNANPGCILFVDEFHGLPLECREALKPTLVPARRYMFEGGYLETIAPFTMIGATTDIGLVDEPLQRRFVMHDLSWMTAEQLMEVIRRRGQSPEAFPIEEDAVRLLIDRTRWSGAPWEALRYYELAGQSAQAQGEDRIRFEHVKDIFDGTASTSTGSARSTDALSSSCSRRPSRARWERTTRPRRKPS